MAKAHKVLRLRSLTRRVPEELLARSLLEYIDAASGMNFAGSVRTLYDFLQCSSDDMSSLY